MVCDDCTKCSSCNDGCDECGYLCTSGDRSDTVDHQASAGIQVMGEDEIVSISISGSDGDDASDVREELEEVVDFADGFIDVDSESSSDDEDPTYE